MKMEIGVAFLFLLAGLCPVRASDENINMARNSSFEFKTTNTAYGTFPLYWERKYGSAGSFDVVTNPVLMAQRSLKLIDNSTSTEVGVWTEPMPVVPGRVYTARAWGYKSSSSVVLQMYPKYFDLNDNIASNSSVSVGTRTNWSEGVKTTTAPTNAAYARLLLYSDDSSIGTGYFDCVSFTLADEMVHDGGFDHAEVGRLPVHWAVYSTHSGAIQDVQSDGDNALRLYDTSSDSSCGASYTVPASPGVPYKFTAVVRKVAGGTGSAVIYLKFFNDADEQLAGERSTSTSSSDYTALTLTAIAPADTTYAKVLCYLGQASTGTAYFDDISFTENYTNYYAYAGKRGNGSGDTPLNAAQYTNSIFWSAVNAAAVSWPVKVTMLMSTNLVPGSYNKYWELRGAGNPSNNILVTGETPFAFNYSNTSGDYFMHISECQNMTFRHIHFTAPESAAKLGMGSTNFDYIGVVRLEGTNMAIPTCNIKFEGLSFTDMLLMDTHAVSTRGTNCHDITWDRCDWTGIGYDLYDHCSYNTEAASNLNFKGCYFQDCAGPYVRYRSRSKGSVEDCTFISTGNVKTGDLQSRVHWSFIQIFAGVTYVPFHQSETLGTGFTFKNNSFTYEQTNLRGFLSPYEIWISGGNPVGYPTNFHLVPASIGAVIEDTSAATGTRNAHFMNYFGVNLVNNYNVVGSNTYTGAWARRFRMSIQPDDTSYWTHPYSETETENVDLDRLVGIDP